MSFQGMRKSIDPIGWFLVAGSSELHSAAPGPIVSMSFRSAIPWQVALQQSPPPLHQPESSVALIGWIFQQFAANGNLSGWRLSHAGVHSICGCFWTAQCQSIPPCGSALARNDPGLLAKTDPPGARKEGLLCHKARAARTAGTDSCPSASSTPIKSKSLKTWPLPHDTPSAWMIMISRRCRKTILRDNGENSVLRVGHSK